MNIQKKLEKYVDAGIELLEEIRNILKNKTEIILQYPVEIVTDRGLLTGAVKLLHEKKYNYLYGNEEEIFTVLDSENNEIRLEELTLDSIYDLLKHIIFYNLI